MKKFLITTTLLLLAAQSQANHPLHVQIPPSFEEDGTGNAKLRTECGIEHLVGGYLFSEIMSHLPDSVQVKDNSKLKDEPYLELKILSAQGHGGGAWSGAKSITLKASIIRNGKVIQTTVKQRGSTGGFGAFTKSTCTIIERAIKAVSRDTVVWLMKNERFLKDSTSAPQKADASTAAISPATEKLINKEKNNQTNQQASAIK